MSLLHSVDNFDWVLDVMARMYCVVLITMMSQLALGHQWFY
jgi:hypothetical protein